MIQTDLSVMNWPVLLSNFGGFVGIVASIFTYVAFHLNEQQWEAKQIRQYFKARDQNEYHKLKLRYKKIMMHSNSHEEEACLQKEYFEKGL